MNTTSNLADFKKRSKILVYFLAAPEEQDECEAIKKHLTPAIRNSKIPIEILSDFEIPAGEDKTKYKLKLLEADIVLALISSDYISDDETYERTQKVIARYNRNETILVPILVRNCLWKSTPFVNLPLLPKNFQPLNNKQFWNSQDDALMAVVEDIYEAINEFGNEEEFETEPAAETKSVSEQRAEPELNFVEQETVIAQPEKTETSSNIEDVEEIQVQEIQPVTEPEKFIAEPVKPESSQQKKKKAVIPINEDWRKQHYRKVRWKRFFAFFLDNLIMVPIFFIIVFVSMVIIFMTKDPEVIDLTNGEYLAIFISSFCIYLIICAKMESSKWRGTFGKRILKLQITDREGHAISFSRALGRNILRAVVGYSYAFIIPFIIQIFRFRKTKKLFHDQLSNTVIGERLAS